MKRSRLLLVLPVFLLIAVVAASAQEAVAVQAGAPVYAEGFGDVICSGGWIGLLNWLGILGWTAAAVPLGLLSIIHCATSRMRQLPLATKLLILGSVWVMVLGLTGFVQGAVYGFLGVSVTEGGAAQQAIVALKIAHALDSLLAALFACQINLLFLLVSMVIRHHKRRGVLVSP